MLQAKIDTLFKRKRAAPVAPGLSNSNTTSTIAEHSAAAGGGELLTCAEHNAVTKRVLAIATWRRTDS